MRKQKESWYLGGSQGIPGWKGQSDHRDLGLVVLFAVIASLVFGLIALSCAPRTAYADVIGTASYYTTASCQREGTSGVWTASGERYNEDDLTCAMRSRAWGSTFRVTNLDNGKSVIVRLNDFGPNKKLHDKGRIVDLSKGAFKAVADLRKGVIRVKVEVVK